MGHRREEGKGMKRETEQKRRLVALTEADRNNGQCVAADAGGQTFERLFYPSEGA